jgi:hypothetical protein
MTCNISLLGRFPCKIGVRTLEGIKYRCPRHRLLALVFSVAIREGTNRNQTNRTLKSTATTTARSRHDDVPHSVSDEDQTLPLKVLVFTEFRKRRPESPVNRSRT